MSIARVVLTFGRAIFFSRLYAIMFEKLVRAIAIGVGAAMSVSTKFVGTAAESFIPGNNSIASQRVAPRLRREDSVVGIC